MAPQVPARFIVIPTREQRRELDNYIAGSVEVLHRIGLDIDALLYQMYCHWIELRIDDYPVRMGGSTAAVELAMFDLQNAFRELDEHSLVTLREIVRSCWWFVNEILMPEVENIVRDQHDIYNSNLYSEWRGGDAIIQFW